jgi:dihydrofolate reductase
MQPLGSPNEDTSGGFKYSGWTVEYWDSVLEKIMGEQMTEQFNLLLDRKTYQVFAAYWPNSKEPSANILNSAKKYVVSPTLSALDWNNSVLVRGDTTEEIRKLKQQDEPELQVHGSSNFIQTLMKKDLVDEFWLKTFPVTIGTGKYLFGEGTIPASFKLVKSEVSTTGVITANYARDGKIKTGFFLIFNYRLYT